MQGEARLLSILIVDDHPLFRKGIRALLEPIADFSIIGEAATGEEAVALATQLKPDVILMDLQMPGGSGLAATRAIVQVDSHVRILVVTLFDDDDSIFAALRAGAHGYLLKDAQDEVMIRAVRAVANREAIFSSGIAARVLSSFATLPAAAPEIFPMLTQREREILALIAQGMANDDIARDLNLSEKTVSNYVSTIYSKLQVQDRAQAIIKARTAGLGVNAA